MAELNGMEFRIHGPPGTGKTTYLAEQVVAAAERYGEDQVSVCSLTNSAVREAVGRVLPIDEENVTTLHARCKRSLGAPAPAESRAYEFVNAYPFLANDVPQSVYRTSAKEDENTAESMLSGAGVTAYELMNIYRQQMIPTHLWDDRTNLFAKHWTDWCQQIGHMDFTGWLEAAVEQHSLPPQQMLYVDEAQDHTPLQLHVIRTWPVKQRHLIGDDDQNLYEWSGAIPKAFLLPELPLEQNMVLSQSYRVPRSIHALAVRWISEIKLRYPKEYRPREADGQIWRPGTDDFDKWQARIEDGTIMVLASCGYMLEETIQHLRAEGIPFHNPYRRANKKWNPLDSSRDKLRTFLKPNWTGSEIATWGKVLKSVGVYRHGMRDRFLPYCAQQQDNVISDQYLEAAFEERILPRLRGRDLTIFKEHRRSGLTGSWDYAIKVMQRSEAERTPRITIGTIHSVKGGQADHVMVMPDLSRAGWLEYQRGETRDRITRLFYVAITRAFSTLTLGAPHGSMAIRWPL